MLKECWSRLKYHPKRPDRRTGLFFLSIIFFFSSFVSLAGASSPININKIQKLEQKYHGDIQKRFKAWEKLITSLEKKPATVQLEEVNLFFNQFTYQNDHDFKQSMEYWKTPEEFIIDGGGDCKDYVIIKYFTLLSLGIPEEQLRFTYVTVRHLRQPHMILTYYSVPDAEPLILDSLESKILKASQRPDLKPVYSFNGEGLWLARPRGQNALIGQPSKLDKWDELMKRMKKQGD